MKQDENVVFKGKVAKSKKKPEREPGAQGRRHHSGTLNQIKVNLAVLTTGMQPIPP
jgi:heterodisulfide reductase subunit A-like polyferredoxin